MRDDEAAKTVVEWHAETQPGPLALLPVSPGPRNNGGNTDAPDLTVEPPATDWVRTLLSGMNAGSAPGDAVRRSNGAIYVSNIDASGPLSRRAELLSLCDELDTAEHALVELNQTIDRAVERHALAESTLEEANSQVENERVRLREAQSTHDDMGRQVHRSEREKEEADAAFQRLNTRIEDRSERLTATKQALEQANSSHDRLGAELETLQAGLSELEAAQEAARERLVHWQVEEAQVSAREKAATDRETRAKETLDRARQEIGDLEKEITEIDSGSEELTLESASWEDTLAAKRITIQEIESAEKEAEEAESTAEAALAADDERLVRAREKIEELNEESHRVELELTEEAGRRRAMVERLEAEWHRPLQELLDDAPEVEGATEELEVEAERLAGMIEAMGPVNPLAVHEHAEETKRLEFLQEQRTDLVEGRKSLLQALREIDETARELFVETFAQIRENFDTVFHTLFEGGECDVRLVQESDPLDSPIEIYAAPRGKRTQRIHLLSSGERALVALSLLFAIYLTKPAPFCLLDEVDAPLDDANVTRFVRLLEEFKSDTQFIVITHNPRTMQVADAVYGVTMQEPGVSSIVGVRLGQGTAV